MKKVKFINLGGWALAHRINPSYYILKSYYKFRGKNVDQIVWLTPTMSNRATIESTLAEIDADTPDILCISSFVWNHERTMRIAKTVKEKYPKTIVVAGGPNLDAHKNKNFFAEHPYIDYVVYGDGEQAFVEILDSIVENRSIDSSSKNAVNIVTHLEKFPFKVFNDTEYSTRSSVLDCKEEIAEEVEYLRSTGIDNIFFQWERARGCPYTCSFCDWSSGLHNKVKRKKSNWKDEIDYLYSLGIGITPTDANWGIYSEDIEITRYAAAHGKFFVQNVAKLNKERAFEIYDILYSQKENKNAGRMLKLSFQDLNEDVLANINRPEIPWDEHKVFIDNFHNKFPEVELEAEIIIGLPGQTKSGFISQLEKFEEINISAVRSYFWEILPNSPAFDPAYQIKFGIQTKKFLVVEPSAEFDSIDDLNQSIKLGGTGWSQTCYVVENNSASFAELIQFKLLTNVYRFIRTMSSQMSVKTVMQQLLPAIEKESLRLAEEVNRTGIMCVYSPARQKIISIDQYLKSQADIKNILSR